MFRLHPIPFATVRYSATLPTTSKRQTRWFSPFWIHTWFTPDCRFRHATRTRFLYALRFEGIPESLQDQYAKLGKIAGAHEFTECAAEVWTERQKLFVNPGSSVICKCSVLPSQIGVLCDALFRLAGPAKVVATLVAQGTGLAEVRLDAAGQQPLLGVLLRSCAVRWTDWMGH